MQLTNEWDYFTRALDKGLVTELFECFVSL